ncbi:MAG: GNAT family N-acetyltransferase [Gammaproteobacteria bacterium]
MPIVYRSPNSVKEFEDYFKIRWELLRKPLGLKPGSEQDEVENSAFHLAAFKNEKIIGVSRLHIENDATARIRYMSVDCNFRNQGIGNRLLAELEKIAKTKNVKICWLYARDNAVDFYLKNNYQIKDIAASELEIKHHRMEKVLHD